MENLINYRKCAMYSNDVLMLIKKICIEIEKIEIEILRDMDRNLTYNGDVAKKTHAKNIHNFNYYTMIGIERGITLLHLAVHVSTRACTQKMATCAPKIIK